MLLHKGGIGEQALGEGGLYPPYSFPVCWAEVGTKCEAKVKEQVLGMDVQECTCNIGMMFDLVEA